VTQETTPRAVIVAACDEIGGQISWTHEEVADRLLAALSAAGFVVARRALVESVMEDAEQEVRQACLVQNGAPHPVLARRYERDMADIRDLREALSHG
jgi:hypothetical protein